MQSTPSDGLTTTALPDGGVTLEAPPLGFRRGPKAPFVFAALWLTAIAYMTLQFLTRATNLHGVADTLALVVFLAVFWLAGLWLLAIAVATAYTRTILTLRGPFLFLTLAGPFRTSRHRWPRAEVEDVVVERSRLPAKKGGPGYPHVRIRFKGWRRGVGILAGHNPRDLDAFADALRRALEEAARRNPHPPPDIAEQPAGSRVVLERTTQGIVLTIPPLGLRGAIPWVIGLGLLVGSAASAGVWGVWYGYGTAWTPGAAGGAVFLGLLALLLFAVAVEAVLYAGCRRRLTVEGPLLTAWHRSLWGGTGQTEWRRSQIRAIDVDASGLPRLRIHLARGKTKRLLIYHTEDELLWIATLLREALQKPHVVGA